MKPIGHLCCRICVGIEVSNLLRILLSKVTNEVSKLAIEFASDVDRIGIGKLVVLPAKTKKCRHKMCIKNY